MYEENIMKKILTINDRNVMKEMLDDPKYRSLALCNNKPYLPSLNFVELNNEIFFHCTKKEKN